MIPKAIIAIVSAALTLFDLIALNATLTFSQNKVNPFNYFLQIKMQLRYIFSEFLYL